MIKATVKMTWNEGAVEQLKREAIENIRRRLERVRCPVHGTRVQVVVDTEGATTADQPCCEGLSQAIQAALR